MGPERDERSEFKEQPLARIKIATKKTIQKYFEHPSHYLFYAALAGIIIGLFFNISYSWELYGIIAGLGILEIINHFKENGK